MNTLAADMPRTIYFTRCPPDQHRLRATGGLIFSSLGLLLSLLCAGSTQTGQPVGIGRDFMR